VRDDIMAQVRPRLLCVCVCAGDVGPDEQGQRIPRCAVCGDGIVKPDIIFFGEKLPDSFDRALKADRPVADLVVVMGSSLKVQPVSGVVPFLPADVPQILINREVVGRPNKFDIELLGDCDTIVAELCRRLGWTLPAVSVRPSKWRGCICWRGG
jgi:NAD-dependent SIR2 family protein deacetylase